MRGDETAAPDARRTVELAAAGDHDAWEQIYRSVYPRLRAYIARHVNADAVDDMVSETMMRAVAGIDGYRWEPAGIDPWVFGIARRVVVDHHRKSGRDRRNALAEGLPASASEPGDALIHADELTAMRAAFERLPTADRQLLELRVIAGLSADEVAGVLGKRPGTIRTAQSRALARLRTIMDQQP